MSKKKKNWKKWKKKVKKQKNKAVFSKFEKILVEQQKEQEESFAKSFTQLRDFFKSYSPENNLSAFFISSIYLPNTASPIKHLFWSEVLSTINEDEFLSTNKISGYDDFYNFLEGVYSFLPYFPSLEDYCPNPDWGEVKFFHEGKIYKILYGSEHSYPYEYLYQFEIVFSALDEKFIELIRRSPMEELSQLLKLQDLMISGIPQTYSEDCLGHSCGHVDIPPKEFWKTTLEFYNNFVAEKEIANDFVEAMSIPLGTNSEAEFSWEKLSKNYHTGKCMLGLFFKCKDKYFMFNPRRFLSVFIERWSELFKKHEVEFKSLLEPYPYGLFGKMHQFLKIRVKSADLLPLAAACDENGQPHHYLFSNVLLTKNIAIFINLLPPQRTSKLFEKMLKGKNNDLINSLLWLSKRPLMIAQPLKGGYLKMEGKGPNQSLCITLVPNFDAVSFPVK